MPAEAHTDSRIAKLEAGQAGLHDDVQGLVKALGMFATETRDSMAALGNKIEARGRTDWSVIIGFLSLVLVVAGAGAAWVSSTDKGHEATLAILGDRMRENERVIYPNRERVDGILDRLKDQAADRYFKSDAIRINDGFDARLRALESRRP